MNTPYTMILVDDEDEVRGRISSKISTESGFHVVGTAGNGYDALELIEKFSPDVVLTDIRMPYIDGIELASIIRREHPAIRVGFITGYNEFDYARQAIQLQVRSYLTKPLTENDILTFLQQLKSELDQEYESRYSNKAMLETYTQSLPVLIENGLSTLLISPTPQLQHIVPQLKSYGIDLEGGAYLVGVVRIERKAEHWNALEFEKLKLVVRTNIEKSLSEGNVPYYSFRFHDVLVFIFHSRETHLSSLFTQNLDRVLYQTIRTVEHFLQVRITLVLSQEYSGFSQVSLAYNEAVRALDRTLLQDLGQLVYAAQIPTNKVHTFTLEETEVHDLQHVFRYGSESDIQLALRGIGTRFDQSRHEGKFAGNFRYIMMGITNVVVHYSTAVSVDIQEVLGGDGLEKLLHISSFQEFNEWMGNAVQNIRIKSQETKNDSGAQFLQDVIDYLNLNFANKNLTMQIVCDDRGISISYLSQLFKKYKSTTFVTFLTGVRMEYAQEKLRLTGSRIVEVADACGYKDVYYFSHCFKKYTGQSPKAYRESFR